METFRDNSLRRARDLMDVNSLVGALRCGTANRRVVAFCGVRRTRVFVKLDWWNSRSVGVEC